MIKTNHDIFKTTKQDPFKYQISFDNVHLSIFIECHATKCFPDIFENIL